jgi:transposase
VARRAKLTQEMVDQAIRLKADGLSNGDIVCALGIHESTFYRWIGEPRNRLQRELSEGLKKEEAAFKRTLLTTIRSAALARNQYWTAAAWLLERKYPDEYGKAERRRDEDGGGDAPRIVLGVVAKPVQQAIDFSACAGGAPALPGGTDGEGAGA